MNRFSGENGKIAYSITSGDEKGDFQISSNGTISTKRFLDREVQGLYNLVITATDQAVPPEKRLSSTMQVSTCTKTPSIKQNNILLLSVSNYIIAVSIT